ncbi:MAG: SNF2-related protein, partial [Gemmataceae bacterium]
MSSEQIPIFSISEESGELPVEVGVEEISLDWQVDARIVPRFASPFQVNIRQASLLASTPWIRSLGRLAMDTRTEGWKFPQPLEQPASGPPRGVQEKTPAVEPELDLGEVVLGFDALPLEAQEGLAQLVGVGSGSSEAGNPDNPESEAHACAPIQQTMLRPPRDTVVFRDRLFYLLQPPLESLFTNEKIRLPFQPFPYQVKGVAFLMPREHALIADEMGLGKTVQVIISLRLLLQSGTLRNALIVCPKPLVINWSRELQLWAPDVPFEVIGG